MKRHWLLSEKRLLRLTEIERKVIERRFGLLGGCIWTLEEIGTYLRLSKERIRQIENKAIEKLRKENNDSK